MQSYDAATTLPILGMPDKIANFIGHYQIDISQKRRQSAKWYLVHTVAHVHVVGRRANVQLFRCVCTLINILAEITRTGILHRQKKARKAAESP